MGMAPSAIGLPLHDGLYSRTKGGSGAFGARGQAAIGLTLLAAPVPPAERAGSEGREKVLKIDGAFAPRVRRFDGLSGRGLWYRLAAMNINAACGSAPPLVAGATTFPPQAGAQQPALGIEQFLRLLFNEALLSHRSAGGRWCRKAPKGEEPPEAAKHRDAYLADESKSIKPESAGS